MNFMSQLYNLQKKIRKTSIWVKLMILLLLVYLLNILINRNTTIEGFTSQQKKFELKKDDLFDDFYVDIYDKLVYNDYKKADN